MRKIGLDSKAAHTSPRRPRARHHLMAVAFAAAALMACLFAAGAEAVTYTAGTPLSIGGRTSSVAVDQATGDVYASAAGAAAATNGQGVLKRFNSAGVEQSCVLSPHVEHPAGLAINPANGNLAVVNVIGGTPIATASAATELRTFAAGCGPELGVITGTADTISGSAELSNVATDHLLREGQVIEGSGLPTATATADLTEGSEMVTNLGSVSGSFAIGQRVTANGVGANNSIVACLPSCSAPTELALSSPVLGSGSGTGVPIVARTTVVSASGSTATLSTPATATATGAAIAGTSWRLQGSGSFPLGQPALNTTGQLYWPNRQGNELQKYTSWGEELFEGGFPNTTNIKRAAAVALDAEEDVFVTSTGTSTAASCSNPVSYKLKKLRPDGTSFSPGEAGVTDSESVFANLTSGATTVAVDKSTGNVYVGIGCQGQSGAEFSVSIYGPGGTKLAEGIGSGLFANFLVGGAFANQLAVNEATGTLYATDPGETHENVQVFEDTSAQKTLSTSVSPAGEGEVQCNGTGAPCLAEYDQGQEVIAEAEPEAGFAFKEWTGGTGSAQSCNNSTEPTCTFTLAADSHVEAVMQSSGPLSYKLNLSSSGTGSATFTCKVEGGGAEPCAPEYEEGESVEVLDGPEAGSEFVEWTGDCTGTGTCSLTMDAEKTVGAVNDLIAEPLAVTHSGEGTVECTDLTAGGDVGPCAGTYSYGHEVEVVATPEGGSTVNEVSGTGSAASCSGSPCTFTITEASAVAVEFAGLANPSTLTVFKGGNGEGTVVIAPGEAGEVECSPAEEACEATFEEGTVVELEESAATESTFAGWLGCRRIVGADRCKVTLAGTEPEVTAVFLAEGKEGPQGEEGAKGDEGSKGEKGDPGQKGDPGEKGEPGASGSPGSPGTQGPQGLPGATGVQGLTGSAGAKGDTGAAGSQGATGPAGQQGPAGKNARVTCKVQQKKGGKKVKVTCTVKYKGGSASGSAVSWRLTKGGHVAGHGRTTLRRLNQVLDRLRPGRYVLHVGGRRTVLRIPARIEHRGGHR